MLLQRLPAGRLPPALPVGTTILALLQESPLTLDTWAAFSFGTLVAKMMATVTRNTVCRMPPQASSVRRVMRLSSSHMPMNTPCGRIAPSREEAVIHVAPGTEIVRQPRVMLTSNAIATPCTTQARATASSCTHQDLGAADQRGVPQRHVGAKAQQGEDLGAIVPACQQRSLPTALLSSTACLAYASCAFIDITLRPGAPLTGKSPSCPTPGPSSHNRGVAGPVE